MVSDISAGLADLADILGKIRASQAWEALAREEARRELPPSFQFSNRTDEDIRIWCGMFLRKAVDIQQELNDHAESIPQSQRQEWQLSW